jgi:alkylated DNA repair dioxygenase AlkB
METYQRDRLLVEFYPAFLSSEEATGLYQHLDRLVPWSKEITPGRRVNQNYGDSGVSYEITVGYNRPSGPVTIKREVKPWGPDSEGPGPVLWAIKERLSALTGAQYNYVVVQRYPSGKVGINPHRDKEMASGTNICGISLNATRTLTLTPPKWIPESSLRIPLVSGSLYIIKPPTNDHWTHSIEKEPEVTEPRISLTYRYTEVSQSLPISQQITQFLALVPVDELFVYHPQVKRVGVIPYAIYQNEIFWLMGVSNLARLGDFGGGSNEGETPIACLLREVEEESSGVLTGTVRDAIGRREGLILWRSRSRTGPPYRYFLFAPIPYADYTPAFKPNSEVGSLVWVRQSEATSSRVQLDIFQTSLHQLLRQLRRSDS